MGQVLLTDKERVGVLILHVIPRNETALVSHAASAVFAVVVTSGGKDASDHGVVLPCPRSLQRLLANLLLQFADITISLVNIRFHLICHVASWSFFRSGIRKFHLRVSSCCSHHLVSPALDIQRAEIGGVSHLTGRCCASRSLLGRRPRLIVELNLLLDD